MYLSALDGTFMVQRPHTLHEAPRLTQIRVRASLHKNSA